MNAAEGRRSDRLTALSTLALGAAFLLLTAACFRKVWAADYWWQWATGRFVTEHGIPREDVFSYTVAGRPWIELRWMFCYVLYHVAELFGPGAVVTAKWLTLTASFSLVAATVFSRRTATLSAAVLTIAVLASSQRFFVRPELATYFLFSLFIWIIDRFRRRGGRLLFLLPPLQIVWTNSHTLFVFGPFLVGLLAIDTCGRLLLHRTRSRPTAALRSRAAVAALVFALTTLACLVNPYGLAGLAFPFRLFQELRGSVFKDTITEFWSPFSFSRGYTALAYYRALLVICVASTGLNLKRLDPFWTILLAAQLYLSCLAIRNVPLFALAAVPFIVHNLCSSPVWKHDRIRKWTSRIEIAGAAAVVLVGIGYSWDLRTNRFNVRQNDTNQFGVGMAEHRFPDGAVAFMRDHDLSGPIFHTMFEGAYLLAHGHEVFIDPRLEVYGEEHYLRYIRTVDAAPGWRDTLREYGVRVVLLDLEAPLVEPLLAASDWHLVHFSESTALFTRGDRADMPRIETREAFERELSDVRDRLPQPQPRGRPTFLDRVESPKPYQRVAEFLITAGVPDLSLPFFADALKVAPDDVEAYRGVVWVHGYTGDRETATAMLEEGLRKWPKDPWMQFQLAVHYFNSGRVEDAKGLVEKSLLVDRSNAEAWSLQAQIHAARGDSERAVDAARRALQLDPSNARYRTNLEVYRSGARARE